MALTKITATNIGANAAANSIGYVPANKAGDTITGELVVAKQGDGGLTISNANAGAGNKARLTLQDTGGATFQIMNGWSAAGNLDIVHSGVDYRMRIDSGGRVTMPYQPTMFAQPDSNVNFATGVGSCIYGWNTSGGIRFNRGFTIGASSTSTANKVANGANTGRITVPAAGMYALYVDQRCEGKGGSGSTYGGQAYVYINGTQQIRRHITQWGDMDYSHCIIHAMFNLAANDFIEIGFGWNNAGGVGGTFSGTGDTVNWMYLTKVN